MRRERERERERERGARREERDKSSERSEDEKSYKLRSVPGGAARIYPDSPLPSFLITTPLFDNYYC